MSIFGALTLYRSIGTARTEEHYECAIHSIRHALACVPDRCCVPKAVRHPTKWFRPGAFQTNRINPPASAAKFGHIKAQGFRSLHSLERTATINGRPVPREWQRKPGSASFLSLLWKTRKCFATTSMY
jgi:hypothetical protein